MWYYMILYDIIWYYSELGGHFLAWNHRRDSFSDVWFICLSSAQSHQHHQPQPMQPQSSGHCDFACAAAGPNPAVTWAMPKGILITKGIWLLDWNSFTYSGDFLWRFSGTCFFPINTVVPNPVANQDESRSLIVVGHTTWGTCGTLWKNVGITWNYTFDGLPSCSWMMLDDNHGCQVFSMGWSSKGLFSSCDAYRGCRRSTPPPHPLAMQDVSGR